MEIFIQIKKLEKEQNDLLAIMAKSDCRQNHCGKSDKNFRQEYEKLSEEYNAAYKKYNENVVVLEDLRAKLAAEREAEEQRMREQPLEK